MFPLAKTSSYLLYKLTSAQQPCKSLNDEPSSEHLTEGSTPMASEQRWDVMTPAIKQVLNKFVITYPKFSTEEDNDHICAYAKEVISLGLLLSSRSERDGEHIIRCWRYSLPLFKVSGCTKYVMEAFNLLFQ